MENSSSINGHIGDFLHNMDNNVCKEVETDESADADRPTPKTQNSKAQNTNVNDVILVPLLFSLNIFHISFCSSIADSDQINVW